MARWLATKTLDAIDAAICADGGNAYRTYLRQVMPHIEDAYKEESDEHRSHLGASVIGGKCARSVAYGWRWVLTKSTRGKKGEPLAKAESRMRRIWNRGHMEEGRFVAMLLAAGIAVYQQDAQGKQHRVAHFGGHFSGSCDGILLNVPDLPFGVPALGEFKTHSNKSFEELKEDGVRTAKLEHFVQMQEYMHGLGLLYALYVAVNKDTDELYAEIVSYDQPVAHTFLERARKIIFEPELPDRIRSASPGYHVCKYLCDYPTICFSTDKPERNCRTCESWFPMPDGTSHCVNEEMRIEADIAGWEDPITLDKAAQLAGCSKYKLSPALK